MSSLRMSLLVVFSENEVGGKGREGLEKSLNGDPGAPERKRERERGREKEGERKRERERGREKERAKRDGKKVRGE